MLRTQSRHWVKRVGCVLGVLLSWMTTTASGSTMASRWAWLELPYVSNYLTRLSQNVMKLSQGEYVALERLENAYSVSPIVRQLYLHRDSLQDHLIGILVPESPALHSCPCRAHARERRSPCEAHRDRRCQHCGLQSLSRGEEATPRTC